MAASGGDKPALLVGCHLLIGQWQSRNVAAGNTMRVSAGLEQVQGKT